jgi:hypothetical protein
MVKVTICIDQLFQISSLFYHSDSISEHGRIASIFCTQILNIPIIARHQPPNLNPRSFQRPFAARNHDASPAVAGLGAAGEQALIMMAASQAKLIRHTIPKQASASAQACTGRQGC